MKAEALELRPARPSLRSLWPTAFLAVLFVILAPRILTNPSSSLLIGLAGCASLIAGGIWLWFRGWFPGNPTLRVDAHGMSYVRGRREKALPWKEIAAIQVDFTLDRMMFVPKSGGKPIVMHRNMVAADGRAWAMLIEDYWDPPKSRGRKARGC